ncbi:MAG: hypothetical protein GOV02_00135 [Candidatus Aenigmarchaeota archaeon]|nr:hypothetical protein [Candidatus Aenigmarchaeota archaeon]
MKLCIIGTKNTDPIIIEEAKKHFEKVLLAPISGVLLVSSDGKIIPRYKDTDLKKFDCVLTLVDKDDYHFAFLLMNNLSKSVFKPQGITSFATVSDRTSLFKKLSENRISVPNIALANRAEAAKRGVKELKFPIVLRAGEKEVMLAHTEQEALSMVDTLQTLNRKIFLEEYSTRGKLYDLFVMGDEVVGAVKKKVVGTTIKEDRKFKVKLNKRMIETALKTARILKTEWARISMFDFKDPKVIDVDLTPSVTNVCEIAGKDVTPDLMNMLKQYSELEQKESLPMKIVSEIVKVRDELKN